MKKVLALLLLTIVAPSYGCVGKVGALDPGGQGGGAGRINGGGGGGSAGAGMPCNVQTFLDTNCTSCHGPQPLLGVPVSLSTYADLVAVSRSSPGLTNAQVALARMQSTTSPMPPAPAARPSAASITMFQTWISSSYPTGTCGGATSDGGSSGSGGRAGTDAGAGSTSGLPCDVQSVLVARCTSCHGPTPLAGVPTALVTYADLTAPSRGNPSMNNAQLALARMQSGTAPMPPAPAMPATSSEIATLQAWSNAGFPAGSCGGTSDGGAPGDGGSVADPFAVPPKCTSGTSWKGGDNGSASMDPGMACINCHASSGGEAPRFTIAGTLYPTAHEPDLCNSAAGSGGAQVVIIGADGRSVTLTPNGVGNFSYNGAVALPFLAKVVYMGRERVMTGAQSSGDCNSCHTQSGTMSAPGRIILP